MRQKLRLPKFGDSFRSGATATFTLLDESSDELQAVEDLEIIAFDWEAGIETEQVLWEIYLVRTNRNRKEMNRRKISDDQFKSRFTNRGSEVSWPLTSGHYVLHVSFNKKIYCETSFFIPFEDEKTESRERLLDQYRLPNSLHHFISQNQSTILEAFKQAVEKSDEFESERSHPQILESTFNVALRLLSNRKNDIAPTLTDSYLTLVVETCLEVMRAQNHVLKHLDAVFELTRDRPFDDDELQALVNMLDRGTDLSQYNEFGILQSIIFNAKKLRIDQWQKQKSTGARNWIEEERSRQESGYQEKTQDFTHQKPEGPTDEFDERFASLSPKQKRKIIPKLIVSILNVKTEEGERLDLTIEDTWTIGRQTAEERKKFGEWTKPIADMDRKKIIIASYFHNTFSKQQLEIIPAYKYREYHQKGRTVSIQNPSRNYAISLGESIQLEPQASYATPKHLHFYYRISKDEIQTSKNDPPQKKVLPTIAGLEYIVRIDVFFESMKRGDISEVLFAKHNWVGSINEDSVQMSFSRTRPPNSGRQKNGFSKTI
ncbi:MAG: hypothetical protein AAF623_10965 [Planctomycetota bacterium]